MNSDSWLESSALQPTGAVAVSAGHTSARLLEAVGAESATISLQDWLNDPHSQSVVAVREQDEHTVILEIGGNQLTRKVVAALLSRFGRTAIVSWTFPGPPRLALAREARAVLTGYLGRRFTLRGDSDEEDVELRTLTRPVNKHRPDLIQTATEDIFTAYTGAALQHSWVTSMLDAGEVHRVVTSADDEHWSTRRLADGSLDPIINASNLGDAGVLLDRIGDDDLRDLAWWIAERLAKYREIDSHPLIANALRTRSMPEEARHLLRKGKLQWQLSLGLRAIHGAVHPDPASAVLHSLDQLQFPQGADEKQFVREVRDRIRILAAVTG